MGMNGENIPLAELGRFVKAEEEPIVYHKDLRGVEYVTGEMEGRLGAPIYGMFNIEDLLENYVTPDGVTMTGMPLGLLGPPDDSHQSGFEWTGEWTVTYETFRDMGGAFMAAMLLIYGLIVWEFKNFVLGGLIMAPIPLTLIGIVPGHWFVNAEFTATSMIGFIALAGIIVRNSILLVEFVRTEVINGTPIRDAVIAAGKVRMRPIMITALTLMAGSFMIVNDLIFKGMAVSLMFGAGVATVLTLVVIPLGCISARKQFYIMAGLDSEAIAALNNNGHEDEKSNLPPLPLWMRVWSKSIEAITWLYYILRMFVMMARMAIDNVLNRFRSNDGDDKPTPPDNSGPSSTEPTPSSGGAATPVSDSAENETHTAESEATSNESVISPVDESASKPITEKNDLSVKPKRKITRKKAAKKRTVSKASSTQPKTKTEVKKTEHKAGTKKKITEKKRRGIRLNPDIETK